MTLTVRETKLRDALAEHPNRMRWTSGATLRRMFAEIDELYRQRAIAGRMVLLLTGAVAGLQDRLKAEGGTATPLTREQIVDEALALLRAKLLAD